MSYLNHCDRVKQSSDEAWRVQWRSVRGTVYLRKPDTGSVLDAPNYWAFYPRYTKLGELLLKNHESERKFIADAIEAKCGIRPTCWVAV